MPEYEGRVAFVEAITTDPRSRSVLERYPTSYIPTSIFVAADGDVAETFVGPLNANQLRAKLDALAADAE
jgi:hypothetical protein